MSKIRISVIIIFILLLFSQNLYSQELIINFTTTEISGAKYSPRHIIAVWIKDSNGKYVRTLMVYAEKRKSYLYTWNKNSGGNTTDAMTGATVQTHKEHSLSWDFNDFSKTKVLDGTYTLCMEMTSDNKQGSYREVEFTTLNGNFTISPPDLQNFTKVSLVYNSGTAGIVSDYVESKYLKIFPNPSNGNLKAEVFLEKGSEVSFSIYDINNKLEATKSIKLNEGSNTIILNNEIKKLPKGIYFIYFRTDHYTVGKKFIIKN